MALLDSSIDRNSAASRRVFEIPELTTLICSSTDYNDCVRLLRVSRTVFSCVRQFVWTEVHGMHHLLDLIPVNTGKKAARNSEGSNRQSKTLDTSRFELYAPYVTRLEMSDSANHPLDVGEHKRAALLRSRESIRFPKLRQLTFTTKIVDGEEAEWITVFLSPSLLEIQFIPTTVEPIWFGFPRCSVILKKIARECPNLQTLRITPGEPLAFSFDPEIDTEWAPQPVSFTSIDATVHTQLGQLHNLRTLISSPAILHPPVFVAISKLPHLESLSIISTGQGGTRHEYALSDLSFSSLKRLELYKVDPCVVQDLCKLQPLLKQLTKAEVFFPVHISEYWRMTSEERFDTTIGAMAQRSPRITELTYNTELDHSETELSQALVNTLQNLRLRTLELECMVPTPECGWEQLLLALPLVEELSMPAQELNLEELRLFATHLQSLCILKVDVLSLESMAVPIQNVEPLPNPSRIPVRLIGSFELKGSTPTRLKKIAKYLHGLWPNMECETDPRKKHSGTRHNSSNIRHLNKALSALRNTQSIDNLRIE